MTTRKVHYANPSNTWTACWRRINSRIQHYTHNADDVTCISCVATIRYWHVGKGLEFREAQEMAQNLWAVTKGL